jgi:hypothetical protein
MAGSHPQKSPQIQIIIKTMTATEVKNKEQDIEAKLKTEKDHAEGKPSSNIKQG